MPGKCFCSNDIWNSTKRNTYLSTEQAASTVKRILKCTNCEPITYLISIIYHIINAVLLQKSKNQLKLLSWRLPGKPDIRSKLLVWVFMEVLKFYATLDIFFKNVKKDSSDHGSKFPREKSWGEVYKRINYPDLLSY